MKFKNQFYDPAKLFQYSLNQKLGFKPEMKVLLIHGPEDYYTLLDQNIPDQYISKDEIPYLINLFAKDIAVFKKKGRLF